MLHILAGQTAGLWVWGGLSSTTADERMRGSNFRFYVAYLPTDIPQLAWDSINFAPSLPGLYGIIINRDTMLCDGSIEIASELVFGKRMVTYITISH